MDPDPKAGNGWSSEARLLLASGTAAGQLNAAIEDTYREHGFLVRSLCAREVSDTSATLVESILADEEGFDAVVFAPDDPLLTPDALVSMIVEPRVPRIRAIGCPNGSTWHLNPIRSLLEERSIKVVSAPDMHFATVAEYVLLQFGIHARRLGHFNDSTGRGGSWPHRGSYTATHGLAGRTVGVIGAGRDGASVIRLALAMGMDVIAIGSGRSESNRRISALGAKQASSVAGLLSEADFVSVTCRPTPETRGMIDAGAFGLMKPGCVIVNTSSAEIFDKAALLKELRREVEMEDRKTIVMDMPYGGLRTEDAFKADPDNPLLKELGVVFTPRMAGYTQESCLLGHRIVAMGLKTQFERGGESSQLPPSDVPTVDEVVSLARQAADMALGLRDRGLFVTYKPNGSPTTNADLACEELIKRGLKDLGYVFDSSCEEADSERSSTECDLEIVIDAIDGTRNFRDGNYGWCTSIAVLKGGRTVVGVVHDTIENATYAATVGEPFVEQRGVRTALRCPDAIPHDFSFSIGSFFVGGTSRAKAKMIEEIKILGGRSREWGSVALSICAVARGGLGVFVQSDSYRYDHAAALFIAQEAGASLSATGSVHAHRTDIVVCHPSLAERVMAIFREATGKGDV